MVRPTKLWHGKIIGVEMNSPAVAVKEDGTCP